MSHFLLVFQGDAGKAGEAGSAGSAGHRVCCCCCCQRVAVQVTSVLEGLFSFILFVFFRDSMEKMERRAPPAQLVQP